MSKRFELRGNCIRDNKTYPTTLMSLKEIVDMLNQLHTENLQLQLKLQQCSNEMK